MNSPSDSIIAFGLNRKHDEQSLVRFLQQFSHANCSSNLVPRLSNEEIDDLVTLCTRLMRKHFSEKEYHRFFLNRDEQAA